MENAKSSGGDCGFNGNGIIDVNDIVSNLMELYATNKILNTLRKGGGLKYLGIFYIFSLFYYHNIISNTILFTISTIFPKH